MSDSLCAPRGLGRSSIPAVALLGLALAAGLGIWMLLRSSPSEALAPVTPASRPDTSTTAGSQAAPTATRPASQPVAVVPQRQIDGPPELIVDPALQKGMLRLPDGNFVPALNGAVDPPAIRFREGRPWSPIVGKGAGTWPDLGYLEYYIHADGTKTFTMKSPVTRSGVTKMESVTLVSHPDETPGPRIPVLIGETEGGGGTGSQPPPRR